MYISSRERGLSGVGEANKVQVGVANWKGHVLVVRQRKPGDICHNLREGLKY
jgi:hypothetical protein